MSELRPARNPHRIGRCDRCADIGSATALVAGSVVRQWFLSKTRRRKRERRQSSHRL